MEKNIAEEETMNKLVKEIVKNGDVKTVYIRDILVGNGHFLSPSIRKKSTLPACD